MGRRPLLVVILAAQANVLVGVISCKIPNQGSQVKDIVGTNANNQQAALTLVPVRNRTVAQLPDPGQNRAMQVAVGAFDHHFLALAECTATKGADGTTLAPTDMTAILDRVSTADQLYVNANRQLVTDAASDAQVHNVGTSAGSYTAIPCQLVGDQLVNWGEMSLLEQSVAALPQTEPTGSAALADRRAFLTKQMLHLAMRGPYSQDPSKENLTKFNAVLAMIMESKLLDVTGVGLDTKLRGGDPYYNPCVAPDPNNFPYLTTWKQTNFQCVPRTSDPTISDYAPASGDDSWVKTASNCTWPTGRTQLGYEGIKYMWNCELDARSQALATQFASRSAQAQANGAAQRQLWVLLSSTQPWTGPRGANSDLATYLATGNSVNGFNFSTFIGTAAPASSNAGTSLALVGSSSKSRKSAHRSLSLDDAALKAKLDNLLTLLGALFNSGTQLHLQTNTVAPQTTLANATNPLITQSTASPTYYPPATTPTYLPQTTATPTYQPQTIATPTYQPQTVATPTYLPQTVATPTYLPQTTTSPTYYPSVTNPATYPPVVKPTTTPGSVGGNYLPSTANSYNPNIPGGIPQYPGGMPPNMMSPFTAAAQAAMMSNSGGDPSTGGDYDPTDPDTGIYSDVLGDAIDGGQDAGDGGGGSGGDDNSATSTDDGSGN